MLIKKAFLQTKPIPKIAIGVTRFKKLVEKSSVLIDKSLFIKEFIESPVEVFLITYPRRWGKSINMDMIKTFLEIEVDKEGDKYSDKTMASNFRLFAEGKIHLDNTKVEYLESSLQIAHYPDIIKQYQGEYPVISIDFKNVKGNSYQEIVNRLKLAINYSFKQHKYMIDVLDNISLNSKLKHSQKITATDSLSKFLRLYVDDGQSATDIDIKNSFKFLSEILNTHFGKKVYILMDEYDTPINNILQIEQFSEEDLENTLMLFRTIMGTTFKNNENLEKGLITGVFRIDKSNLFSDLNNIIEYNFLNNEFARYYVFTEDELKNLFDEYKIAEEDRVKAESWYDGYRVAIDKTLKIYNPWAIVNFLHYNKIENYWEETGSIDFIKKLFKIDSIREKLQSLLSQEDINDQNNDTTCILVELENLKFSKDDFITLKELVKKGDNYKMNNLTVDLFFRYIFAAGYLTIADKQVNESVTHVKLPNQEVKSELEKKLRFYYKQIYNKDTKLFNNCL